MNAYGIGFGSALAAAYLTWMTVLAARRPEPVQVGLLAVVLAFGSGVILVSSWCALRQIFRADGNRDMRAEFRAADPRGWKSAAAGFLSAIAGLAAFVGIALAGGGEPGSERDPNAVRVLLVGAFCLAASPFVGSLIFLRLFGRRPTSPPPDG